MERTFQNVKQPYRCRHTASLVTPGLQQACHPYSPSLVPDQQPLCHHCFCRGDFHHRTKTQIGMDMRQRPHHPIATRAQHGRAWEAAAAPARHPTLYQGCYSNRHRWCWGPMRHQPCLQRAHNVGNASPQKECWVQVIGATEFFQL
ncbi:hypothetical protein VOLCADRAFT_93086 [Volvox carteri f. nagariensis]|uniref:Uncharacterized protein n=1 Tax=Volvox carteri f. nagariensis TaxID=3068 RepID=D8U1B1_VOLCA|nr:uncharacterized protein VOLCADRAFT_93086 [Volvox carteri f. nagariensis]EFJ46604.1 hypothetical protein VOLCADRAFT_93086 [Volvox carteri f. nagariensis]|eukprot:XP_002952461.1 hypothetical protein VOLCADRAFT_93086 [Volvox carteri f. nagariensis]